MAAIFFVLRRLARSVEETTLEIRSRVAPILGRVQLLVEEVHPQISNMVADAAHITHLARTQVQHADRVVGEAIDRLRCSSRTPTRSSRARWRRSRRPDCTFGARSWDRCNRSARSCAAYKRAWNFSEGIAAEPTRRRLKRKTKACSSEAVASRDPPASQHKIS